jgi:hypothetical protein
MSLLLPVPNRPLCAKAARCSPFVAYAQTLKSTVSSVKCFKVANGDAGGVVDSGVQRVAHWI